MDEAGAMVIGSAILIPGLLGVALSFGCLDRRAGNPPLVWVSIVWNGLLFAGWMMLCVAGVMAEA